MARGKAKGSAFERFFCKELSLWWTEGGRDDVFWRTAGSGAMATARFKKGKRTFGQAGDIQAIDPIGQPLIDLCTIELKRGYNSATIQDFVDSPNPKNVQFQKFIDQVEEDRINSRAAFWMLVTKRDQRKVMVWFNMKLIHKTDFELQMEISDILPNIKCMGLTGIPWEEFTKIKPICFKRIKRGEK